MNYTVVWVPNAERRLADLWLDAVDRRIITAAANELEQRLSANPETAGESRSFGRRILIVPPLAVNYRVYPEDRVTRIISVWQFEKGRPGQ